MTIVQFAEIIKKIGGTAYIVGGFVRDEIMNVESHDCDIMITGISIGDFNKTFPKAKKTGNSFPVFRLEIDEEDVEVAFARKEKKVAKGHNGFEVVFSPDVTIEEDLERRDIRMNAMAKNILTNEIVDVFNGKQDINNKEINVVSHIHFQEDPLRVLRVARQASKFGFSVSEDAKEVLRKTSPSLVELPKERIFGELEKALATRKPSIFFRILKDVGALEFSFPMLFKLIGQTQPKQWHPEGDAFEHSMLVLDKVSQHTNDIAVRFCALYHDIGKATTPKEKLPKHIGHDLEGVNIINNMPSVVPFQWKKMAKIVAKHHMNVRTMVQPSKKIKLLLDIKNSHLTINDFRCIVCADSFNGENDLPKWLTQNVMEKVFAPIQISCEFNPKKDGTKIKEFVMSVRCHRIKNI